MSLRRKTPVDMAGVKRSRACSLGKVTTAATKVNSIKHDDPAEIRLIAPKELERILASLEKTEAGFEQSFEDAMDFVPTGEEEDTFYEEEEAAKALFDEAINTVKDQAKFLIDLRKAWSSVANLSRDVKAMETNLDNGENCTSFNPLMEKTIEKLREQCDELTLSDHHSVKEELEACTLRLGTLRLQASAAISTALPSSIPGAIPTIYRPDHGGAKLPPISLPTFTGDIMEWSNFWMKFTDVVDKKEHLSDTTKLTYLKQAIIDPAVQVMLNSPTEGPDTYKNLVKSLHQRYERTKKIHRDLVGKMDNLPEAKNTSQDLRKLVDETTAYMASIKQTGHYSLETFVTSMVYSRLPYKVKLDWDDHHAEEKVVAPFHKLLEFVSNRAYSLADNLPTPTEAEPSDRRPAKATDKKGNQSRRANVHVATTPTTYKYDCSLCVPEKHPLYACPKWLKMTVQQRLEQVKARNLCSNCLAPGHTTEVCRSRYRCTDCQQPHSSTLHQSPTPLVAIVTPESEAATMMTAQVLLTGPRGERIKARALIDPGAAISLITSKVAQQINLPLAKTDLHFSGVSGAPCKPAKHCTELAISTLQGTKTLQLKAAVVPVVTAQIPAQEMAPVDDLPHLAGLPLADPTFHIPGRIDILLGAKVFVDILTKQMVTGSEGEPAALETIFGWAIVGASRSVETYNSPVQVGVALLRPEDKTLTDYSQHYWMSEQPEEPIKTLSSIEQEVQQLYTKDMVYDSDRKIYTVELPRDTAAPPLGALQNPSLLLYNQIGRYHSSPSSLGALHSTKSYSQEAVLPTLPISLQPRNLYHLNQPSSLDHRRRSDPDLATVNRASFTPTLQPRKTATLTLQPTKTATQTLQPAKTAPPTLQPAKTATLTLQPAKTATRTLQPTKTATPTLQPTKTATLTLQPAKTATRTLQPPRKPLAAPEQRTASCNILQLPPPPDLELRHNNYHKLLTTTAWYSKFIGCLKHTRPQPQLMGQLPNEKTLPSPAFQTTGPNFTGAKNRLNKLYKFLQSIIRHFWNRWHKEYLQTLQSRTKWTKTQPTLQEGDVVILKENKLFNCHWSISKITKTYPSSDGLVRVALTKTSTSTFKRPVTKLALLHRGEQLIAPPGALPPGACSDTEDEI